MKKLFTLKYVIIWAAYLSWFALAFSMLSIFHHHYYSIITAIVDIACLLINLYNYKCYIRSERITYLGNSIMSEAEVNEYFRLLGLTPDHMWNKMIKSYAEDKRRERLLLH